MEIKTKKFNMRNLILELPTQFKIGFEVAKGIKFNKKFDSILIAGMGGSALPGNILDMWLKAMKIGLPLYIHRDYGLPDIADERTLVICISNSGGTEETVSVFEEAKKKGLSIAVIASGGKLIRLSKKYKVPFALIPSDYPTRLAQGFLFSALMKILLNCELIREGLGGIMELENNLEPAKLESQGKILAKKLKNKIPLIYSSAKLKHLARIWKINFNENSKTPSYFNYFPELNHNEISSFENGKNLAVIILRDVNENKKILERMKLTAKIITKKGNDVYVIDLPDKEILYKIFSSLILSNWASYYLALEYGKDPIKVSLQDEIKNKLQQ
ncbi:MAG: bifunctional phosphoglucose/phosphomannose isomerase [Candidatus Parcubacteria bacterium]|nr:bifunctional phosphoglucose/phosphomannose isomerase [Candidatus Parcubacteria bacterium]